MFENSKESVLAREDASRKGSVDEAIRPLLALINSRADMYTTSSCAGRIVLMSEPASGMKKDARWLYSTHSHADPDKVMAALEKPGDELVWFRMEPFIIHLAVKDLESANSLLRICIECGLKHSGILSTSKRIMMEITGNERLDAPVCRSEMLVGKDYLAALVEIANAKLVKTRERMAKLYQKLDVF